MSSPRSVVADEEPTASKAEYDSDEEPMEEDDDELKWRGDPIKTHSDWKIEIVTIESRQGPKSNDANNDEESSSQEGGSASNHSDNPPQNKSSSVDTYHVHKYILGYGKNRSAYFERLFQTSERYAEAEHSTSRIELDPVAAKAFPQLLDFVYSTSDNALNINTENATALHYLGQYFEIRRLRWLARQFWKKDLALKNVDMYYEHAKIFHDDKVLQDVASICAENIMKIKPSSRIVQISDPGLWITILEKAPYSSSCRMHMSSLIAEHCRDKTIDVGTFSKLSGKEKLPKIAFDAASTLSDLEDVIVDKNQPERNIDDGVDAGLSSLQERCVASMSQDWKKLDFSKQETMNFLKRKKPLFLAELLAKSLNQAKGYVEELEEDAISTRQALNSCQSSLNSCQSSLRQADAKVRGLERELSRFRKVDGSIMTELGGEDRVITRNRSRSVRSSRGRHSRSRERPRGDHHRRRRSRRRRSRSRSRSRSSRRRRSSSYNRRRDDSRSRSMRRAVQS